MRSRITAAETGSIMRRLCISIRISIRISISVRISISISISISNSNNIKLLNLCRLTDMTSTKYGTEVRCITVISKVIIGLNWRHAHYAR